MERIGGFKRLGLGNGFSREIRGTPSFFFPWQCAQVQYFASISSLAARPPFPRLNFNYLHEILIELFSLMVYIFKLVDLGNLFGPFRELRNEPKMGEVAWRKNAHSAKG